MSKLNAHIAKNISVSHICQSQCGQKG